MNKEGRSAMYKINDFIIYSSTGVCKIEDIRSESFNGESRKYYILKPIYSNVSTVYAPCGTSEERMKEIISPEDIIELIHAIPDEEVCWIDDDTRRKDRFSSIIKNGSREELMLMIKTLYFKREERMKAGKRLHNSDEKLMKDAERILYEEFALVLNIKPDDVTAFISKELGDELPEG